MIVGSPLNTCAGKVILWVRRTGPAVQDRCLKRCVSSHSALAPANPTSVKYMDFRWQSKPILTLVHKGCGSALKGRRPKQTPKEPCHAFWPFVVYGDLDSEDREEVADFPVNGSSGIGTDPA